MWKIKLLFLLATALAWGDDVSPDEALKKLLRGNDRFVKSVLEHPHREDERRIETAIAQKPFAVVLGCSDSRVPPEILFDQGIGDLFIVRVAGNVVGPIEKASIDFAVLQLGASLIFVLGHQDCGAVSAVVDGKTTGIEPIAKLIEPAVVEAKEQKGRALENAINDNVRHVVKELQGAEELQDLINKKKLAVVGGVYDLQVGRVQVLTKKP